MALALLFFGSDPFSTFSELLDEQPLQAPYFDPQTFFSKKYRMQAQVVSTLRS